MNNLKNIAVYLGSSGRCRPIFKQNAAKIGQLIAQKNKTLIYGGMDAGLMGIVANNALEGGAEVIGVIPIGLKDSLRIHPLLSQKILVNSLWERKLEMFHQMDAAITLAGGYGTADELFEVLYWAHLGSHTKPMVLVNTEGYYNELIAFMDTLPDLPRELLIVVNTPEEAFARLDQWKQPPIDNASSTFTHFEDEILHETDEPYIIENASVKDAYILTTALGLKQLQKHERSIGILNTNGQYDLFLQWVTRAQKENFITKHCMQLYSVGSTNKELKENLKLQPKIQIDLENDKWGKSETQKQRELIEG
jgi:hypothetical protein